MKKIFISSIFILPFLFDNANAQLQPIDYQLKFYSSNSVFTWAADSKEAYRGKIKDTSEARFQEDSLALHIPFEGKFDSVRFIIDKAYNRAVDLTSCHFIIVRKKGEPIILSVNKVFTEDQTSLIRNLKKGDELIVRQIFVSDNQEGSTRQLSPLEISIE